MRERPIICYPHEVRAILNGRQSQTRRILKPMPAYPDIWEEFVWKRDESLALAFLGDAELPYLTRKCPYGHLGDRIWVRETWAAWHGTSIEYPLEWDVLNRENRGGLSFKEYVDMNGRQGINIAYRADGEDDSGWESPIFMPRWASRITLEITDVRVQRLQEISDEDALAEGVDEECKRCTVGWVNDVPGGRECSEPFCGDSPVAQYERLWNSINAKKHPWESNPWVWAITFKRVQP